MGSAGGQRTGPCAHNEMDGVVMGAEAPSVARRVRRAERPGVAAEPDRLQGPHEAARSQARHARVEKAAVSTGRLAVAAARGEEVRGSPCSSLERAAVLLGALRTIGGTEVPVSGTPAALYAEVRLRTELTEGEHESLLEVLTLADQRRTRMRRRSGSSPSLKRLRQGCPRRSPP